MAREHARILTSIWADPDFRERSPEAQRLYVLVLSQSSVNNAGVVPLQPKKWARGSTQTTPDDLDGPLRELHDHRYLVVDPDADEALIRSFIRNDGVWRQPNVLKSALRQARGTYSPVLREALAAELARVEAMLPAGKGYEGIPEELRRTVAQLSGEPVAEPHAEPSADPPSDPPANGRRNGHADRSANPSRSRGVGEGVGEGAGASPSGDLGLGGSRARETAAGPSRPPGSAGPPPLPSEIENTQTATAALAADERPGDHWPEQPCGNRHDPERSCRRCGVARRAAQDQAAEVSQLEADERAAEAARRRACQACDPNGWVEDDEGRPIVRCDHERDRRSQLADALDHAS